MALTRAQAETVLIRRCSGWMTEAGLDTEPNSTAIDDPLAYAARHLGESVTDLTAVVDGDLDGIAEADYNEFLDVAEVRLLENILEHVRAVDVTVEMYSERFSQMADRLEKVIARKLASLAAKYGYGYAELEAGVINHDFMQNEE